MRSAKPAMMPSLRLGHLTQCCGVLAVLVACQPKADAAKTDSAKTDSAVVSAGPTPTTQGTPTSDPAAGAITEFGYGPLRAGMTYAAANDSLKGALKAASNANLEECDFVTWEGGPAGLGVMVMEGKIARIDVKDSSTLATVEGARIGDTEDRIKSLYGARVTVTEHKYEDGHYLTVRSALPTDTLHFIIFETSGGKVMRFRAGAMPGVEYVEGCS